MTCSDHDPREGMRRESLQRSQISFCINVPCGFGTGECVLHGLAVLEQLSSTLRPVQKPEFGEMSWGKKNGGPQRGTEPAWHHRSTIGLLMLDQCVQGGGGDRGLVAQKDDHGVVQCLSDKLHGRGNATAHAFLPVGI